MNASLRTTSWPSPQCLSPATTAGEALPTAKPEKRPKVEQSQPKKKQPMKSQKWNIKPTAEQKALLRLWFDAARLVYNKGVEHANDTGDTSLGGMRAATGIDDNIWKREAPKRLQDCIPYEIRDSALQDLNKAAATLRAKARKRGEKGKHVKYKFRTRKSGTESITLRKRQLNCKSNRGDVWPALFGTTHDRSAMATERGKVLPSVFEFDTRLLHDMRTGAYYLCIPMPINRAITPETQGPESTKDRVVSIDPGVRTFATCYDPAGELTEWGINAGKQLFELKKRADAVDRAANVKRGRQKTRTRRVAAKLRQRGRDLVNELHRKLALWLCKEHQTILLPEYQTQGMMKKKDKTVKRRISRTTCGRMSGLSFYKFKQFLEHKAQELGSELIKCNESYTSVTCGTCGLLNTELGASKHFVCRNCGLDTDRDWNAARNILLRYIAVNNITWP